MNILWGWLDLLPAKGVSLTLRGLMCRLMIKRCGQNLKISRGCVFYRPKDYCFGDHVYVGLRNYFGNGVIELGDEVMTGPNVSLVPGTHTYKKGSWRFGEYDSGKIVVGKGVWLGANVVVLNGVTIGASSIIAAGTVVTSSVPSGVVFAGVPGRVVKKLVVD